MSERMESHTEPDTKPKSKPKTLQVVPAEAGPDIQPVRQKRPMTEAQLAALKRGRQRLAEKRKAQHEEGGLVSVMEPVAEPVAEPVVEPVAEPSVETHATQTDAPIEKDDGVVEDESEVEESETYAYCVVM